MRPRCRRYTPASRVRGLRDRGCSERAILPWSILPFPDGLSLPLADKHAQQLRRLVDGGEHLVARETTPGRDILSRGRVIHADFEDLAAMHLLELALDGRGQQRADRSLRRR